MLINGGVFLITTPTARNLSDNFNRRSLGIIIKEAAPAGSSRGRTPSRPTSVNHALRPEQKGGAVRPPPCGQSPLDTTNGGGVRVARAFRRPDGEYPHQKTKTRGSRHIAPTHRKQHECVPSPDVH